MRLANAAGQPFDDLPAISDGMPFKLYWSPRSDWFFVNHYQGSSHERLRLFQVVNGAAVERSALFAEAARLMIARYPCLGQGALIFAAGAGWNRAGRKVAFYSYARPDACWVEGAKRQTLGWATLAMIGDAESGRIDFASIREIADGQDFPTDGPYAEFAPR